MVVTRDRITIRLWDHGSEDGDEVLVTLNRKASRRVRLTKAGTSINLVLAAGANTLEVKALNEGKRAPNTASIRLSDVSRGKTTQKWNLKTNQSTSMTIYVVP